MDDIRLIYNLPRRKLGMYEDFRQFDMNMYDAFPYKRNSEMCGAEQIAITTGNVVKFTSATPSEPFIINNDDD